MKKVLFRVIMVSIGLWTIQVLAASFDGKCMRWECEAVYCPTGYAIEVPGKGYLPCDRFDEYIDGNTKVLR